MSEHEKKKKSKVVLFMTHTQLEPEKVAEKYRIKLPQAKAYVAIQSRYQQVADRVNAGLRDEKLPPIAAPEEIANLDELAQMYLFVYGMSCLLVGRDYEVRPLFEDFIPEGPHNPNFDPLDPREGSSITNNEDFTIVPDYEAFFLEVYRALIQEPSLREGLPPNQTHPLLRQLVNDRITVVDKAGVSCDLEALRNTVGGNTIFASEAGYALDTQTLDEFFEATPCNSLYLGRPSAPERAFLLGISNPDSDEALMLMYRKGLTDSSIELRVGLGALLQTYLPSFWAMNIHPMEDESTQPHERIRRISTGYAMLAFKSSVKYESLPPGKRRFRTESRGRSQANMAKLLKDKRNEILTHPYIVEKFGNPIIPL